MCIDEASVSKEFLPEVYLDISKTLHKQINLMCMQTNRLRKDSPAECSSHQSEALQTSSVVGLYVYM